MTATKTYANRSNARRAAKAAGLDPDALEFTQVLDGTWTWAAPAATAPAPKASRYRLHRKPKAKVVPPVAAAAKPAAAPQPATAGDTPKHKDFQLYSPSQVTNPVQFVHQFLDANGKGLTRKQALYELAQHGVNYATARTQYQRWFTANK